MKNLEYYMNLPYRFIITPDKQEGGYVLSYPDLPGCLTCAENIDELIKNGEDAKREWLKVAIEDNVSIIEPINNEKFTGQLRLRMPKSLHKRIATNAKNEGISMNQYIIYLLSKSV